MFPRIYNYTMTARIGDRPITALEIAEELKIDPDLITGDFQVYIESLIDAAIVFAEHATKRTLIDSSFTAYLDGFYPGASYEVRLSPFISTVSIYNTVGGSQVEVPSTYYYNTNSTLYSVIGLNPGYSWPSSDDVMQAVTLNFTAGYTDLPADLKKAVMQYVGALYVNRGDCSPPSGTSVSCSLPTSVRNVFNMYRIKDIKIGM